MNLILLPDFILSKIIVYLSLEDLMALGESHSKLKGFIYKNPEIWTSDLLFPEANQNITDKFIQKFVPKITRHYGILTLKMIDLLSLSPIGYLLIFDQFAHSVKHIEIRTTPAILSQLVHHLTIFAGNLALLQGNNNIPITFRQYAFDDEHEYESTLIHSNLYASQGASFPNLISYLQHNIQLDDPPFERLEELHISCTSNDYSDKIQQLEALTFFLSGRTTPNIKKRSREEYMLSPSPSHKIADADSHYSIQYRFHPDNVAKKKFK